MEGDKILEMCECFRSSVGTARRWYVRHTRDLEYKVFSKQQHQSAISSSKTTESHSSSSSCSESSIMLSYRVVIGYGFISGPG
jgi:hypothetical protein